MKWKNIFEVQFHHEQGYDQTGFEFSPCNKSTPISEVAIGCTLARWDWRGIHCSHFIAAGDFPQTTFFILQKAYQRNVLAILNDCTFFSGLTINFLEEATHPLPWLDRYLPNLSRHLSLRPIWLALDDWIRTGWSATNRSFGCIFQSSRLQFPLIWKPRQHPVGENTDISTNTKL